MKRIIFVLFCLSISGCAYNQVTITADNNSTVYCSSSVDKPVDISNALKGNVPLQGGVINDSGTNSAQ